MEDIFILSAVRTPIGSLNGALASYSAPQLGGKILAEAVKRAGISPDALGEVVMGNVLSGGVGQAPARQAMIQAQIPVSVGAATVNKVCGSGLKAVMMASQSLALGEEDYAAAGGMESMSQAPFLLEKARNGYRYGNGVLVDSILKDGLIDPYSNWHMGECGELCAETHALTREMQDAHAAESYARALKAQQSGTFSEEIFPIDGIALDEEPGRGKPEKIARLKPVFKTGGTITAANASKLNDGAAALVLSNAKGAAGKKPLARIVGWATFSQEPKWFTTAPAGAIDKLLKKTGWSKDSVDLFEVNEAFSVVALAVSKLAGLSPEKVNVNGGAVALGHPLGASGARILVTLLYALKAREKKRGIAAICLGGGESVAVAIERI